MNETTELIMRQLNSKKTHAETHELGGGDEIDVAKLKGISNYVTKTGDFSGTWNGLPMTSVEPGLSTAFNEIISGTEQGEKINLDGGIRLGIRPKMPIVTFTSDDGKIEDYTVIKPIFQSKGIPLTMGIITSLIDGDSHTTTAQLKELYGLGWEIVSHTHTHPQLATLTDTQIDDELRISKETLETGLGIPVKHIIFPYGSHDARVRKAARKYYRSATSTNPGHNGKVHRTYQLNRVAIGAYFDVAPGYPATNTLAYYKQRVDEAISNNAWLVFMLHPWHTDFNATQQQYLSDLIDYIKSKSVPIMNIEDALDKVGNLIDIGDHGAIDGYLAVGSEGETESTYAYKKVPSAGLNASSPLSSFASNTVSVTNFSIAANAGFPQDAGILETYNLSTPDYAFQNFYHYGSDKIYRRRWDSVNNVWLSWLRTDAKTIASSTNAYTATSPFSAFPTERIIHTKITAAGATGFPFDVAGLLVTNTITTEAGYPRQTYYVYDQNIQYERHWTVAGAWSGWEKVVKRLFEIQSKPSVSFGTVPANGQAEQTFTITGVKTGDAVTVNPRTSMEAGLIWGAYVSAADTVVIRVVNVTTSAVVTTARTWTVDIHR